MTSSNSKSESGSKVGEVGFRGVWSDFRLSPTACLRKVVEGQLKIVGRDKWKRTIYEVLEAFDDSR